MNLLTGASLLALAKSMYYTGQIFYHDYLDLYGFWLSRIHLINSQCRSKMADGSSPSLLINDVIMTSSYCLKDYFSVTNFLNFFFGIFNFSLCGCFNGKNLMKFGF